MEVLEVDREIWEVELMLDCVSWGEAVLRVRGREQVHLLEE